MNIGAPQKPRTPKFRQVTKFKVVLESQESGFAKKKKKMYTVVSIGIDFHSAYKK